MKETGQVGSSWNNHTP